MTAVGDTTLCVLYSVIVYKALLLFIFTSEFNIWRRVYLQVGPTWYTTYSRPYKKSMVRTTRNDEGNNIFLTLEVVVEGILGENVHTRLVREEFTNKHRKQKTNQQHNTTVKRLKTPKISKAFFKSENSNSIPNL